MTEMYYGKDRNALRQGQKCIMALTEMYYAKKEKHITPRTEMFNA